MTVVVTQNNITSPNADVTALTVGTANGLNFPNAGTLGYRNLITNGAMELSQRGSASVTATGQYPVDRFVTSFSVSSAAISSEVQEEAPAGFFRSLRYRMTTAATAGAAEVNNIQHRIEGVNIRHLNWGSANAQNVTLSFWVRSSNAGTYCVSLRNDVSQTRRSYVAEYTIQAADTWERITIPIDGDTGGTWLTNSEIGVNITWDLGSGSNFNGTADSWLNNQNRINTSNQFNFAGTTNAQFYLTGVQLEVGDVATPFEHRPRNVEIGMCQRYYCQSYNFGTATGSSTYVGAIHCRNDQNITMTNHFTNTRFPVVMRTVPTVTLYSPEDGVADRVSDWNQGSSHVANRTVSSVTHIGSQGFGKISLSASNGPTIIFHYTANGEL